jgi:hypothetical protein
MTLGVGDFLHVVRTIDRLLALEKKHGDLIEALDKEVRNLITRVATLESREDILVTEAKAAAATAASVASSAHLADLARHIGALEERVRRVDGQDLSLVAAGRETRRVQHADGLGENEVLHNS